jgi:hypothetical protein
MDYYVGPAVLIQEGRRIAVECRYRVTSETEGGVESWSGAFRADPLSWLDAGEATLERPDGRSARVIITRLRPLRGEGSFVGGGEPPERGPVVAPPRAPADRS